MNFPRNTQLRLTVVCVICLLVSSYGLSANALTGNQGVQFSEIKEYKELSTYINSEHFIIEFNHEQALNDGLCENLVMKTKDVYEQANEYLAKEFDILTGSQSLSSQSISTRSSVNRNEYVQHSWWRADLYLCSITVTQIQHVIAAGGGAAQLLHFVPGGTPVAIVSGVIATLTVSILGYHNAAGTGVKIYLIRDIYGGWNGYWIKSQSDPNPPDPGSGGGGDHNYCPWGEPEIPITQ